MGLKRLAKRVLPPRLVEQILKRRIEHARKKTLEKLKKEPHFKKDDLVDDLRRLGLQEGDTVLVHSSLSKIGYVEGGADTVIDALLEVIGNQGTLLMPTLTVGGRMVSQLREGRLFDYRNTPTGLGIINEAFRKRAGVLRSIHPTHSVCGIGPNAEFLLGGTNTQEPLVEEVLHITS